jgi:hypothetical protein
MRLALGLMGLDLDGIGERIMFYLELLMPMRAPYGYGQ